MKLTKSIILIVIFLNSAFSEITETQNTPWTPEIIKLMANVENTNGDGFLASIHSICYQPNSPIHKSLAIVKKKIFIDSRFETGGFEYKETLRLDREKKVIKAPIVFLFPGIFGNLDEGQVSHLNRLLLSENYHIISFPNPWGTDYIKKNPLIFPGQIFKEAEIFQKAAQEIYLELKNKKITNSPASFLGVSYGSFLAAIVSANFIYPTLHTTLISPPFEMSTSLNLLDTYLDKHFQGYSNLSYFQLLKIAAKICYIKKSDIDKNDIQGLTVYGGFHRYLHQSIELMDDIKKLNYVPKNKNERVEWRKNLRFKKYLHDFKIPDRDLMGTPIDSLDYWIKQIHNKGQVVRVLTSQNDFINPNYVWNKNPPYILLLKDGGHYGYPQKKWFTTFMRTLFHYE